MDRRSVLAFGTLSAMSIAGCGGGGSENKSSIPSNSKPATGWTQMPIDDYRNIPEAVSGNFRTVGGFEIFDLSDNDFLAKIGVSRYLPEPSSQGQQPSCTAWAVGYAAATAIIRYSGNNISSPISPADLFAKILKRSPAACTSGSLISYAMDTLVQEGVVTLDSAPYSESRCGIPSSLKAYNIDGFSRISATDTDSVRGSVQSMQPVSFGMLVSDSFFEISASNSVYVPNGIGGGHAMSVVGYDDRRQQYKIMNSWGKDWGASGFFWLSYTNFARYATDVCIPYLRRSQDNELLASATSNQKSPISGQHMRASPYGNGIGGSFGVGVEMGWSAPLDVRTASISVMDNSENSLFIQNFSTRQIARGIRFGTKIPNSVASTYILVKSMVSGFDSFGAPLTLSTITKPYQR